MAGVMGDRSWAMHVAERVEAGESVARIAIEWASDVLGRRLLRGGKHTCRPDAMDLQAGDYHDDYQNDDRVAI